MKLSLDVGLPSTFSHAMRVGGSPNVAKLPDLLKRKSPFE